MKPVTVKFDVRSASLRYTRRILNMSPFSRLDPKILSDTIVSDVVTWLSAWDIKPLCASHVTSEWCSLASWQRWPAHTA